MAPTPRRSLPLEGRGQCIHGRSLQEDRARAQAQRLQVRGLGVSRDLVTKSQSSKHVSLKGTLHRAPSPTSAQCCVVQSFRGPQVHREEE